VIAKASKATRRKLFIEPPKALLAGSIFCLFGFCANTISRMDNHVEWGIKLLNLSQLAARPFASLASFAFKGLLVKIMQREKLKLPSVLENYVGKIKQKSGRREMEIAHEQQTLVVANLAELFNKYFVTLRNGKSATRRLTSDDINFAFDIKCRCSFWRIANLLIIAVSRNKNIIKLISTFASKALRSFFSPKRNRRKVFFLPFPARCCLLARFEFVLVVRQEKRMNGKLAQTFFSVASIWGAIMNE